MKFDDLRATRVDDKGAPIQVKADIKESFLARREFLPKRMMTTEGESWRRETGEVLFVNPRFPEKKYAVTVGGGGGAPPDPDGDDNDDGDDYRPNPARGGGSGGGGFPYSGGGKGGGRPPAGGGGGGGPPPPSSAVEKLLGKVVELTESMVKIEQGRADVEGRQQQRRDEALFKIEASLPEMHGHVSDGYNTVKNLEKFERVLQDSKVKTRSVWVMFFREVQGHGPRLD